MSKFDALESVDSTEPSAEYWTQEAAYWRKKTARAHLAYSAAYWDYELAKDMEGHCLFLAETIEAQALAEVAEGG